MRVIEEIILHCSGTDVNSYDFNAIKNDHVNNRGWNDIGYHFGIDWIGGTYILRDISKPGAHCKGRNTYSIGVCVLGRDKFYEKQYISLAKICKTMMMIFNITKENIRPHNFYNKNKQCPCFDVDWFVEKFIEVK